MNDYMSRLADGLVSPRFEKVFGGSHDVKVMYRAAARSMAEMRRN